MTTHTEEGIGILEIKLEDEDNEGKLLKEYEFKPDINDYRRARKLDATFADNKHGKFSDYLDQWESFIIDLYAKSYEVSNEIAEINVVPYLNPLIPEIRVGFRLTTRKELEKAKQEALKQAGGESKKSE